MLKKLNLPFTNEKKKGGKAFKILNEDQLNYKKKDILDIIKNMVKANSINTTNKINYIKGSNTKEYYERILNKI